MEAMKKQFVSVQAKRMALGENPQLIWRTLASDLNDILLSSPHCFFPPTETRRKASAWQRNLGYPLVMLLLLALTVRISIFKLISFLFFLFFFLCLIIFVNMLLFRWCVCWWCVSTCWNCFLMSPPCPEEWRSDLFKALKLILMTYDWQQHKYNYIKKQYPVHL